MSADNWRRCPKCLKLAEKAREGAIAIAKSRYGAIPEAEYRKLIQNAESPLSLDETLREDYCQGTEEDGTYSVEYYAGCKTCGFEFTYKHSQQTLS